MTVVIFGRRRFLINDQLVELEPGRCTLIAAGSVRRSLPEPAGVFCLNFYVPAGHHGWAAIVEEAEHPLVTSVGSKAAVNRHGAGFVEAAPPDVQRLTIGALAAREGMSREGFTRAYARRHGMPPHAHDVAARLNKARRQLRAGGPLAEVALDAGLADQSHLGRCFRRSFGVTPGHYRDGWSQTFQTRG